MLFLSYTSTEKGKIVIPLKNEIKKYGISLWIDKEKIFNGNEIYNGICTAIDYCNSAIVIISSQYMNKYWTMHELELICKKCKNNPNYKLYIILHNVTKDEFRNKFPKIKNISYDCYTDATSIIHLAKRIACAYYHNYNKQISNYNKTYLKNKCNELYCLINIYDLDIIQNTELLVVAYMIVEFCAIKFNDLEIQANITIIRLVIENIYAIETVKESNAIENYLLIRELLEIYLKKLIKII